MASKAYGSSRMAVRPNLSKDYLSMLPQQYVICEKLKAK